MKQVSAKHYYYIALHIITTQKQRYVPQLIVHVDIIRAECEFLQLMLLRTKISLPWATYIIISSVSGSETWPKQYINKQEKAVFSVLQVEYGTHPAWKVTSKSTSFSVGAIIPACYLSFMIEVITNLHTTTEL